MSMFEPRDPLFADAVRDAFSRQRFMQLLGAELAAVEPGEVAIAARFRPDFGQQAGTAHAGVLAAIADSACGFAARTLMEAGSDVVSVEFKLNLLAPAVGTSLLARGRVIRAGRTITVCAADIFADEKLLATMLATMMRR